jgi:glutaredoxin
MPLVERLYQNNKQDINFITMLIDGERDKRAREIIKSLKITMPVLLILKENVIDTYMIRFIPQVFFIDKHGLLVGKVIGQREWDKSEAVLMLKEVFKY